MGGKTVAQFVRADPKRDTAVFEVFSKQLIHGLLGDTPPQFAQKQRAGSDQRLLPVALDCRKRRATDGRDALLRALADYADSFTDKIHVLDLQC